MNAMTPIHHAPAVALMPNGLREAMDLATMMARGKLVPAALQNSAADCLLVIEQAMRWRMSPFAVAQEVSVIQGKLMLSGKIVAAAINTSGVIMGRLAYTYSGEGDDLAVTVHGAIVGEDVSRDLTVRLRDAKTNNRMWTVQPEQQLAYFGARAWARRHAPEVMLGVYAPEEMEPEPQRSPPREVHQVRTAIEPPARQADVVDQDEIPALAEPIDRHREWANGFLAQIATCRTEEDLYELQANPKITKARAKLHGDRPELETECAAAWTARMGELHAAADAP